MIASLAWHEMRKGFLGTNMKKKKHSYTFKQMAVAISKEEGKKHELSIAQISEVLKIVKELLQSDIEFLKVLLK